MAYTRKDYVGGAVETTITTTITGADTTIVIADTTGWPSGSNGPFVVVIGEGTAAEEKVLCASRTSTALTVSQRGYDGTNGTAHSSGASIAHCLSATDLDEANYTTTQTVGKVTTAGDMLVASGANTFSRLAKGSASTVLGVTSGGTLGYTTVTSAMIADGTIAAGDLATNAVETAKIKNGAVTADKLAAAVAGDGLTGGAGTALAVNAGTGLEINTDAVRVASSLAGDGLTGGGGSALAVNTGSGLEINSDTVRVAASLAGDGLTGGGGSALAVGAGTGITVNANDVAVDSSLITTGATTTWSPTVKQGSSTASHTVEVATYHRTGRLIHCHLTTKITATVGAASTPTVSLPVPSIAMPTFSLRMGVGTGLIKHSGGFFIVHVWLAADPVIAYVDPIAIVDGLATWGDWDGALVNDDYIDIDFKYEAAS